MYLIISHNYRFEYVIRYSSSDLPLHYLVSSFWAGQEGSFLLWTFLGAWLGVVFLRSSRYDIRRIMLFYNLNLIFLCILLIKQSPFRSVATAMVDGFGLNILLQDPWMVIHPPVVFLGYAAFAVPYSIAMASLWDRGYAQWIEQGMKWVLFSFLTLGIGIILGGFWSYKVLGWGGYWGWDPVENASLLPWLMSIALIHGMIVQRVKRYFIRTNYYLISISFLLIIYSTFLTRSGVLANFSVHSFVDLGITSWLVVFMGIFFILSVVLIAIRSGDLRDISLNSTRNPLIFSREFGLLAAVILLATSAMATGLGTSAPLLTRVLEHPSNVPHSYYAMVNFPIAILIAFLLSYIPLSKWGQNKLDTIKTFLIIGAISGAVVSAGLLLMELPDYSRFLQAMIILLVFFAVSAVVVNLFIVIRYLRNRSLQIGGALVHLGVAIMFLSIIISTYYERSEHVELPEGKPVDVMGYSMRFIGPEFDELAKGTRLYLRMEVERDGQTFKAAPDIFVNDINDAQTNRFHRPHIRRGLLYDLYVSPEGYETAEDRYVMDNTYMMQKNDTLRVDGYTIVFEAFDLSKMVQGSATQTIKVGAVLNVISKNTSEVQLVPYYEVGMDEHSDRRVQLPGEEMKFLYLNGIDANSKSIELFYEDQSVTIKSDEEAASMFAEISIKPAMSLLWFGVILLISGAFVSIIRYSKNSAATLTK